MNELSQYDNISVDQELYHSLKQKDFRFILRQVKSALETFNKIQELNEEMFTYIYFSIEQIQKEEFLDFIIKYIICRKDCLEFEIFQLKFLQVSCDVIQKQKEEKKENLFQIQKHILLNFDNFEKHGKFGLDTLLKILNYKIKDQDIKIFLQNQFKQFIKQDIHIIHILNRLINILFNTEECEQQISELILYSDNNAFITQFTTQLAQNCNDIQQPESNSLKQVGKVFQIISSKLPNIFNQNLPIFIQFYENENYQLRNICSTILTNIITQHLNPNNTDQDIEMSDKQLAQRITLIKMLFSRIVDKAAFARVHVLKLIRVICSQNLIPANLLLNEFSIIIGRIKDQSALVRKASLTLIKYITKFMKVLFVDALQLENFLTLTELEEQNYKLTCQVQQIVETIEQVREDKCKAQNEEEFKRYDDEEQLITAELNDKKNLKNIFNQYYNFMIQIQETLPNIILLLNSKSQSDIIKSISVISFLFKQKIEKVDTGIMKMLIHSNNPLIVTKIAKKFYQIFFKVDDNQITIQNLYHLLKISSQKEIIYLECLFSQMIQQEYITNELIECIWNYFINCFQSKKENEAILYSYLIRMLYKYKLELLTIEKIKQLQQIIENSKRLTNWTIIIQITKLLQIYNNKDIQKEMFKKLALLLFIQFGTKDYLWFVACQEILNLILKLPVPENLYQQMIERFQIKLFQINNSKNKQIILEYTQDFLIEETLDEYSNDGIKLSQLLFIVGQSALGIIVHIDEIENQLTRIRNAQESNENELDRIQGGSEEEYEYNSMKLQKIAILTIQNHFFINYTQIIFDILQELDDNTRPTMLHLNACLCLCKFMCFSEQFCETHIEFLFKLIQLKEADSIFKNNLIVAIGDLLHRWPNTVTSYCRQLFDGLCEQDEIVKKTSLNMLSYLILNDMIKIKREITDIALLLSDQNEEIIQCAKRFFYQLYKKDQRKIINCLPDMINTMSNQQHHTKYKEFLNHILKYLDKQTEPLVEKLLKRLKDEINEYEVLNISLTLSKLQMKESLAKKFYECYAYYQERLANPEIKEYFQIILQKLSKCGLSQENKQILIEFEELLSNGQTKRRLFSARNTSQKSLKSLHTSQNQYSNLLDSVFSQNTQF